MIRVTVRAHLTRLLLAGCIALQACYGAAARAATVATVTLEFYVPAFIDVLARPETADDGSANAAGALLTITTNQTDWVLVAGLAGRGLPALAAVSDAEGGVALQIDVAEHDLRGSPSVARALAWRHDEPARLYTVVDKGGAGPFQYLRLVYSIHPAVMAALREMGPLHVVITVVM